MSRFSNFSASAFAPEPPELQKLRSSHLSHPLQQAAVPKQHRAKFFAAHQPLQSFQGRLKAMRSKITDFIRPRQRIKGTLSESDRFKRNLKSYVDDYQLKSIKPGQQIQIDLKSKTFDPYLRLIDARTNQVLLEDEDRGSYSLDARLAFTAKAGTRYILRVSRSADFTYNQPKTGNYVLRSQTIPTVDSNFNFFSGYGLVNAAAAVARTVSQNPFADLPPLGGNSWNLDMVKAPEVWARGYTGQGITVAVLDEGVDVNHPELQNNIWRNPGEIPGNGIDDDKNGFVDDIHGWSFVDNSNNLSDISVDGHGTHIAGTIAAANDGVDTTGIAYNAKIMPVKVITPEGALDDSIAQAIDYAVQNGANVINMSFSKTFDTVISPQLQTSLQQARSAGVVVLIAAGNNREFSGALQPDNPAFSAAIQNLGIAVGSVDINQQIDLDANPAGKQRLNFVDAPGDNIYSTIPVANAASPATAYGFISGTSMATAHATGIVALMLSANPTLTPAQVEAALLATASNQAVILAP